MNRTCVSVMVCVLLMGLTVQSANGDAGVAAKEVRSLGDSAVSGATTFFGKSLTLRLAYEYAGRFLSAADKTQLHDLALGASQALGQIQEDQSRIKADIEAYEGDDWDRRYGVTGLWRKLHSDVAYTTLLKCRVDYYLAIASGQEQRQTILEDIISTLGKGNRDMPSRGLRLLTAQTLVALGSMTEPAGPTEPSGEVRASQILNGLLDEYLAQAIAPDRIYFDAAMLRIALNRSATAEQLAELTLLLDRTSLADDLELNLRLVFTCFSLSLNPQYGEEVLNRTVKKFGRAKNFLARTILDDMTRLLRENRFTEDERGNNIRQKTPGEIALAVEYAMQKDCGGYGELFERLCEIPGTQRPLVLFAAAQAKADNADPAAVEYYLRAARAQQEQTDLALEMSAAEIAAIAARAGYRLWYDNEKHADTAQRALGVYCQMAGDQPNRQLQYLHAVLLRAVGRDADTINLLSRIGRSQSPFAARARLDMIVIELDKEGLTDQSRGQVKSRLAELIGSLDGSAGLDGSVKVSATKLYCRVLLEKPDVPSAEQVLRLIEKTPGMDTVSSAIFKAGALRCLGDYPAAARTLATVLPNDNCQAVGEALAVLEGVIVRIDGWQAKAENWEDFIRHCRELAMYCLACAKDDTMFDVELIAAELLTMLPGDAAALEKARAIMADIMSREQFRSLDWIRCSARLLTARGDYHHAALIWDKVATANTAGKPVTNGKSWQWWRAKYYQLYCVSRLSGAQAEKIAHAVEVLTNSYGQVPTFWAGKLEAILRNDGSLFRRSE